MNRRDVDSSIDHHTAADIRADEPFGTVEGGVPLPASMKNIPLITARDVVTRDEWGLTAGEFAAGGDGVSAEHPAATASRPPMFAAAPLRGCTCPICMVARARKRDA